MVIENDEDARDVLSRLLTLEGFEVGAFENCADAMKSLNRERYDVAIVDLGLPHVSGMDCAEKMRFQCPEMYLIAYTAYPEALEPEHVFKKSGFDTCLRKGEAPEVLINAVKMVKGDA